MKTCIKHKIFILGLTAMSFALLSQDHLYAVGAASVGGDPEHHIPDSAGKGSGTKTPDTSAGKAGKYGALGKHEANTRNAGAAATHKSTDMKYPAARLEHHRSEEEMDAYSTQPPPVFDQGPSYNGNNFNGSDN